MDFKTSETFKNLQKAYEGEQIASTKYRIYADQAKKEDYQQIASIFEKNSYNEKEHAEIWLRIINNDTLPTTLDNLKEASAAEKYECTKMYQDYANVAEQEGFTDIARLFRGVAQIECFHEYEYETLVSNILSDQVFCKQGKIFWVCMNCGNVLYDTCAPKICPVCSHSQGFYKKLCEDL